MNDYCKALSISEDEISEMHLKKKPYSYFVNNHFEVGLNDW